MKTIFRNINELKKEFEFWVGESAMDNFAMIDIANSTDLWFHLGGGESSCHVICRMPLDLPSKKALRQIITQGAIVCKQYSRRKSDKNVPIIYTKIENLEKTNVAGCVLTKNIKTILI